MPLFDPTFYSYEQQEKGPKQPMKPKAYYPYNRNLAIAVIIFGILSIIALIYVPA